MDKILLLYFEKTRSRADGKGPILYRIGGVPAWCRNASSAAVNDLSEKVCHGTWSRQPVDMWGIKISQDEARTVEPCYCSKNTQNNIVI